MNGDFDLHVEAFAEALRVQRSTPQSIRGRLGGIQDFRRFCEQRSILHVREVTAQVVHDYQVALTQRPLAAATRCGYTRSARRLFAYLTAANVVLVDPFENMPKIQLARALPRLVLTRRQARQLLNQPDITTPKGLRDRAILELFYATGIRLGEMLALTLQDVDCRSGLVRVNKGKFSKDRVVPMGKTAAAILERYITQARSQWVRASIHDRRRESALWLSSIQPHGPLKPLCVQVLVRHCGQAAGIRGVSAHIWRHTCATHLVSNGANIAYVQRILGHESIETTQIYARVTLAEIKATYHKAHPRNRVRSLKK
jgi:integrase/recombinase XerD